MLCFIDTHCHLFWEDFAPDLPEVVARAQAAGVDTLLIPATNLSTLERALAISSPRENIFVAAGIHPQDAKELPEDWVGRIRAACGFKQVMAIGEIGLDYHYEYCPRAQQREALGIQLDLAKELDLPVILHNRESDEDLIDLLREHQDG